MSSPFRVYLAWSGRTPLYVGQTGNLTQRLTTHRTSSPWWSAMTSVTAVTAESREDALEIESHYIQKLRPLHNVHMNPRWILVVNEIAWAEYLDDLPVTPRQRKSASLRDLRQAGAA